MKIQHLALAVSTALALALAACGGGGGSTASSATPVAVALAGSTSSGSISAFGSVFVNGHEFSTVGAKVMDDDSGTSTASTTGLEVGMVVDVKHAASSTAAAPAAAELHLHPLARGYVDASNSTDDTLTVMGQTVQLTSATNFSDHRACVAALTSPCSAVTGQSGLVTTTGSGTSAVAGMYVTVHGYLFGAAAGSADIVATLVSVADAPASTATGPVFKVEGVVSATAANAVTVGGLNVDLSSASCTVSGAVTPCASAFSTGQVVAAVATAQPSLPVISLVASRARVGARVTVDVVGTPVEVEGSVASVTASPAAFVLRGVTIDASGLGAGFTLPGVGDIVRVLGTVGANGQSITATSVKVLHIAASASVALLGDAAGVTAGATANTYTLSILGQTVTVTADTRLMDQSTRGWDKKPDPATNPFNISSFQTYLAASTSQHLIIVAEADATGKLTAASVKIVPANTQAGVAGMVDVLPAPVNSSVTGTASTFAIHGLVVSADPAAIFKPHAMAAMQSVAAGDEVIALGTFVAGQLSVSATPSRVNTVVDFGVPKHHGHGGF